jgi:hypothetical protein
MTNTIAAHATSALDALKAERTPQQHRDSLARCIARDVAAGKTPENNIFMAALVKAFLEIEDELANSDW